MSLRAEASYRSGSAQKTGDLALCARAYIAPERPPILHGVWSAKGDTYGRERDSSAPIKVKTHNAAAMAIAGSTLVPVDGVTGLNF